jgi:hypothetical protein
VVDVTDRAHVHVGLGPLEFALSHGSLFLEINGFSKIPACRYCRILVPLMRIERMTSPLPRECSATELQGRKIWSG